MKNILTNEQWQDLLRHGCKPAAAAELTVKSTLIIAIGDTIKERHLTQQDAAQPCGTGQPTVSKVLRRRMEGLTIDKLAARLNALGRTVETAFALMTARPTPASSEVAGLIRTLP